MGTQIHFVIHIAAFFTDNICSLDLSSAEKGKIWTQYHTYLKDKC